MVLTTSLLTQIRSDVKDDLEALFLHGAIGTDNTTPVVGNTFLGNEVFRDAIDSFSKAVADKVTASLNIGTTEANGSSIAEFGWFDTSKLQVDNANTADWNDSADMTTTLNTTTFKEATGALDLTKDAGSSATASTSKTTTSQNFTDRRFSIWIYVLDAAALTKLAVSNALTIRFGSDSGNYYEWQKDRADLAVGWNLINTLTSANADSTTGTPVIASMDYTFIGLTATGSAITWSAGDFIMDDIRLLSETLYVRDTLTSINKTDSIQLFLDTTITIVITEV